MFWKSWKSTVIGVALGAMPILETTLKTLQTDAPIDVFKVLIGLAIMALGVLMKEYNVSGGNR